MIPDGPPATREEAASLLRAVRRAPVRRRLRGAGWLLSALPGRPMIMRLAAEAMLANGDIEGASALITLALHRCPAHPGFTALRVECLLALHRYATADAEARVFAARRPRSARAGALAGRAALAAGAYARAARTLRATMGLTPHDDDVRRDLIAALLATDRAEAAALEVRALREADPVLRARVLRAQGRDRDATDVLEASRARADQALEPKLLYALVDTYEAVGATPELEAVLGPARRSSEETRLRAAEADLARGAFRSAARGAMALRGSVRHQRRALSVLVVALAARGRISGARRAYARLQRIRPGADPTAMARLWISAAVARAMGRQLDPGQAAGDRNPGVLTPLIRHALEVLECSDPAEIDPSGADLVPLDLAPFRAACRRALASHEQGR